MSAVQRPTDIDTIDRVGNYNTTQSLWENSLEHHRDANDELVIIEGHVLACSRGIVARFNDDAHAIKVLEAAGYVKKPSTLATIYIAPMKGGGK